MVRVIYEPKQIAYIRTMLQFHFVKWTRNRFLFRYIWRDGNCTGPKTAVDAIIPQLHLYIRHDDLT